VQVQVAGGQWVQPGPAYRSEQSLLLEDFSKVRAYAGGTLPGVTQKLEPASDGPEPGGHCAVYTAVNTLTGPGGWSAVGRALDPPRDFSWHKGIGFWLRGDGRGGQFKLQLRDGKGATDYYVTNDYEGWRYHQLARPVRDPIDYSRVTHLGLYYNSLPATNTVTCAVDDVRALPALDEPVLANPSVEVAGNKLRWPVTLRQGQALTCLPGEDAVITGPKAADRAVVESPPLLTLPPGKHAVRFNCEPPLMTAASVRLMLEPPDRLAVTKEAK
jgi:hypothetical protein